MRPDGPAARQRDRQPRQRAARGLPERGLGQLRRRRRPGQRPRRLAARSSPTPTAAAALRARRRRGRLRARASAACATTPRTTTGTCSTSPATSCGASRPASSSRASRKVGFCLIDTRPAFAERRHPRWPGLSDRLGRSRAAATRTRPRGSRPAGPTSTRSRSPASSSTSTGSPRGRYCLISRADPLDLLEELDEANNVRRVRLALRPRKLRVRKLDGPCRDLSREPGRSSGRSARARPRPARRRAASAPRARAACRAGTTRRRARPCSRCRRR